MKFYYIIVLLTFSNILNSQNLSFNSTIEINKKNEGEIKDIKNYLISFFSKIQIDYNYDYYWAKKKDTIFKQPYGDLATIIENDIDYTPLILSIKKRKLDEFEIKSAWIKNVKDTLDIKYIYNFIVAKENGNYVLKNILYSNIEKWKYEKVKNIFYYSSTKIDKQKALEFNQFNNTVSLFFNSDVLDFTYFKCKNTEELMKIRGFDFEYSMILSSQNGGESFTNEKVVFSGNNSEINEHELVHLYTFSKHKKIHNLIDEGISTYLGGSQGLSYIEHLYKLKQHLKSAKINVYKELFFENYVIDEKTSLWYTIGAFLCDLCLKKYGKNMLFELMNSGKKDVNIVEQIEKVFKINRNDFNSFIRSELEEYEFKE
jgi:hypothetical protein